MRERHLIALTIAATVLATGYLGSVGLAVSYALGALAGACLIARWKE